MQLVELVRKPLSAQAHVVQVCENVQRQQSADHLFRILPGGMTRSKKPSPFCCIRNGCEEAIPQMLFVEVAFKVQIVHIRDVHAHICQDTRGRSHLPEAV
jgi:hypothetical protein